MLARNPRNTEEKISSYAGHKKITGRKHPNRQKVALYMKRYRKTNKS
jgi:hypothetical protein